MKRLFLFCFLFVFVFGISGQTALSYRYWIDTVDNMQQGLLTDGEFKDDIDFSSYKNGAHVLTFQVSDGMGNWSVPRSWMVYKTAAKTSTSASYIEYWIDDVSKRTTSALYDGVFVSELDFMGIADGFHTLTYRIIDDAGKRSVPRSTVVMKRPRFSENLITAYQYWFNGSNSIKTVKLDNPVNPYELTAVLPFIGTEKPSKDEVYIDTTQDGLPKLLYLNRLYTRFCDTNGSWSSIRVDTFGIDIDKGDVDLSSLIVNPDAVQNRTGWDIEGVVGNLIQNTGHYRGTDIPYFCLGNTTHNGWSTSMSQTIEGLPAGSYIVSVAARAASGVNMKLYANDESVELPSVGAEGGEIWQAALEDSPEKLCNEGKGYGWSRRSVIVSTDGGPLTIKAVAVADGKGMWADFVDFKLATNGVTSLKVSYADSLNPDSYKDMKLVLKAENGQMHITTTSAREYSFDGISADGIYSLTLENAYGQQLWRCENFTPESCGYSLIIDSVNRLLDITLNVHTPEGIDVSDAVDVVWYNAFGEYMGGGCTMAGMAEGNEIVYDVTLGDSLGVLYSEPEAMRIMVSGQSVNMKMTLLSLPSGMMTGNVYAGKWPAVNATVSVSQNINGRYALVSRVKTDDKGNFALELPLDSCRMSIAASGYFTKNLIIPSPGELGKIELEPIRGDVISLRLKKIQRAFPQAPADTTEWTGGTRNIAFSMRNITQGIDSIGLVVQGNSLIATEGLTPGDCLEISAHSLKDEFEQVSCKVIVAEDGSADALLTFIEHGGISLTIAGSSNQETRAILFDASGHYVDNQALSFTGNVEFAPLKSGSYSLVVMGHSDLLGNVSSISTLDDASLVDGQDYLYANVNIEEGRMEPVELGIVPVLDETPFYFTSENASFSVNKSHTVAGSFITYTAKIEFKENYAYDVSDVSLVIDIPEGCSYVSGSAIVGSSAAVTSEHDGKLIIHLNDNNYRNRIRFCLVALNGGRYLTHATLNFNCDGEKIQPLGRLEVIADDIGINVPAITNVPEILVSGMCQPNASVAVYDGKVEIASVRAKSDGSWSYLCGIDRPYNMSVHEIHAEIETGFGALLTTATEKVEYNINANRVKSVTMINTAHGPHSLVTKEYVTKFDFINPSQEEKIYWFWPKYPTFTFIVDFIENNPEKVENVYVKVHTSSGDTKVLKADYSISKNRWIATGDFNSFCMPSNVSVAYDKKNEIKLYDQREGDSMILSADEYSSEKTAIESKLTTIMGEIDEWFDDVDKDISKLEYILKKYNIYDESSSMNIELQEEIKLAINKLVESKDRLDVKKNIDVLEQIRTMYTPIINSLREEIGTFYSVQAENGVVNCLEDVFFEVKNNLLLNHQELLSEDYKSINTVDGKTLYIKYGDGYRSLYDPALKQNRQFTWTPYGLNDKDVSLNQKLDLINNEYELIIESSNSFNECMNSFFENYEIEKSINNNIVLFTISESLKKVRDKLSETFIEETGKDILMYSLKQFLDNSLLYRIIDKTHIYDLVEYVNEMDNDFQKLSKSFNEYDDFYNRYQTCFGSIEGALVKGEIYGAKEVEAGLVLAKTIGVGKFFVKKFNQKEAVKSSFWKKVFDYTVALASTGADVVIDGYHNLMMNSLKDIVGDCEPKEQNEPSYEEQSPDKNSRDVQDPSGYVYEAVTSNRLSGVTATIFELQTETDIYGDVSEKAVAWNAEKYSQRNPQFTDDMGMYAWDVPQGQWQVRFFKPGYDPVATEWLPVPPPQLDVNIGMHQAVNPNIEKTVGYESGITFTFDKYMKPGSFADGTFTVRCADGEVKGSYEFVNLELAPGTDKYLASKVKFVPEIPFKVGETVTVKVAAGVLSYSDMPLLADFTTTVIVQSEIRVIETDTLITVPLGATENLEIAVLPVNAAARRILTITNGSPSIATVSDERIRLDGNGCASIGIRGDLPGMAQLIFAVEGSDIVEEVAAKVEWVIEKVSRPVASIVSGSHVDIGTPLALKCSTEGASIYYTVDGSSPADYRNKSRKHYTVPIIIDRDMAIKAIAEKNKVASSDVAEFTYYTGPVGISNIVGKSPNVMADNGDILLLQCNGCSCDVFDVSGIKVWAGRSLTGDVRISLSGGPLFIVRIQNTDGSVTVNTVGVR